MPRKLLEAAAEACFAAVAALGRGETEAAAVLLRAAKTIVLADPRSRTRPELLALLEHLTASLPAKDHAAHGVRSE
jgi:hypothetical protein